MQLGAGRPDIAKLQSRDQKHVSMPGGSVIVEDPASFASQGSARLSVPCSFVQPGLKDHGKEEGLAEKQCN